MSDKPKLQRLKKSQVESAFRVIYRAHQSQEETAIPPALLSLDEEQWEMLTIALDDLLIELETATLH